MPRPTLLVCGLLLAACAGGPSAPSTGAADGPIPAQGPCDEPLLDEDVVASGGPGGPAVLVAAGQSLADGPLLESVESLAGAADLVVRGTVGGVVGTVGDAGRDAPVRPVEVVEVLGGDAPSELRVAFVLGDTAGERCAPVVEGREVVLFLVATGSEDTATHAVLGSHNNGVLTVDGDRALVHSWVPGRLREADPPRDDLPADGSFPPPGLAFDLGDVREVVTGAA